MDHKINWQVGVVTTKRIVSTLDVTLESLDKAGWPLSTIVSNRSKSTAMETWIECLSTIVTKATMHSPSARNGNAKLLICEDDILISEGLRSYLDSTEIPSGVVSLYTAAPNHCSQRGWHEAIVPRHAHGALAYVLDAVIAKEILTDSAQINRFANGATDRAIGYFCRHRRILYWCHSPSFVYHLGEGLSAVDDGPRLQDGARNCADWLKTAADLLS